jgi:hypothetical protein
VSYQEQAEEMDCEIRGMLKINEMFENSIK